MSFLEIHQLELESDVLLIRTPNLFLQLQKLCLFSEVDGFVSVVLLLQFGNSAFGLRSQLLLSTQFLLTDYHLPSEVLQILLEVADFGCQAVSNNLITSKEFGVGGGRLLQLGELLTTLSQFSL